MTHTIFKASLNLCGLSQKEAASFFDVRLDTVKSWSIGRNPVPPGVWQQLRYLYATIVQSSEAALDLIEEKQPDELFLNEHGPRSDEWPSDGPKMAALAMVALAVDLPFSKEN